MVMTEGNVTLGNGFTWIFFVALSLQPLLFTAVVFTTKFPALPYFCLTGFCMPDVLPFGNCHDHCTADVSGRSNTPRCCISSFTQIIESPPIETSGLSITLIGLPLNVSTHAFCVFTFSITE